jgi:hypothetical protein
MRLKNAGASELAHEVGLLAAIAHEVLYASGLAREVVSGAHLRIDESLRSSPLAPSLSPMTSKPT